MAVYAIVVAGGEGRRFGSLKQFYSINGRPLLLYCLDTFESSPNIKQLTLVVPKDKIKDTITLIKRYGYKKIRHIVQGGIRRQDSVYNGFQTIKDNRGIVVVHDAVRPKVSQKLLNKGIKLCRKYKAVIFGMPMTDTLKEVKENLVIKTVSRKRLYPVQTPQFFDIALLRTAYETVNFDKEWTDESAILEAAHIPVYLFKGDPFNIKITTRQDLKFLSKWLK